MDYTTDVSTQLFKLHKCPQCTHFDRVADQNIGAEILLPGGDQMARGYVVAWSHDTNENILGIVTRLYQVEFAGSIVALLAANVIAESIYTQCDAEGNEHLLLDLLFDFEE